MMMQNRLNDKAKDIEGLKKQTSFLLNSAWEKGYVAGFDDGYKTSRQAEKSQRPQGEWINQSQGAKYPCECSECHTEPLFDEYGNYDLSDFCPKCGADLRGGTQ